VSYESRKAAALAKHGQTPYQLRLARAELAGRSRQAGRGHAPPAGQNVGSIRRAAVERRWGVSPAQLTHVNRGAALGLPKPRLLAGAQYTGSTSFVRQLVDRAAGYQSGSQSKRGRQTWAEWQEELSGGTIGDMPPELTYYHD
jgi:hypothetical protein